MNDSRQMRSGVSRRLKSAKRALRQEYLSLCRKSEPEPHEYTFVLSYSAISDSIGRLMSSYRDLPRNTDLAKTIILQSRDKFPEAERLSVIISGVLASRQISSWEIDTLKTALKLEIILSLGDSVGTAEIGRLSSLHDDIVNIDFSALTESFDLLHASLLSDESYRESDTETQKEYRRRIRWMAQGDEQKAAHAIISDCRERRKSVGEYILAQHRTSGTKMMTLSGCHLALTLILSLGFGLLIGEWWAPFALLLPSFHAAKSIVDGFILFGRSPVYLWRLRPDSQALRNEKAAIVLHCELSESIDTMTLSSKLTDLASKESGDNIKVVALIDLAPEQAQTVPEDASATDSLAHMINRLNEQEKGRYLLFIRKRKYSDTQEEFIGESGRLGAISELCRYISDGSHDFSAMFGDCRWLIGTKYILTVNEDTTLEMGAASSLLSIAMHPANRPVLHKSRVISGYGIIAPDISHKLESALSSGFSKVFGMKQRKSSVYSELFGEGEFCGIGLIDTKLYLMASKAISGDRHLDSSVLVGEMLRCAHAGDVKCYDRFPQIPQGYYRKLSCEVKSGLQNLRGVFMSGITLTNKLRLAESFILKAVPISVMANMYLVFWFYPPAAEFTALLGLAMWLFPAVFETIKAIIFENNHEQQFYSGLLPSSVWGIKHIAYSVVMLPTLAIKTLGAFAITLWRMITRKRLLSSSLTPSDPISFYILPELISLILLRSPGYSVRLLGLFFALMPVLLAFSESENSVKERRLSFKDSKELSQYISDSWRFFDNFVTDADNGLPPESVQFSPVYRITHRASPADIGLYLMSCLAAYDRKLISAQTLAARVESCLDSLDKLDKVSGCLFEKYDTISLKPVSRRLSSEEMGVFLSSLICLKEGLNELGAVFEKAQILAERTNRLISDADMSIFYDSISGLMCYHFDADLNRQSDDKHSLLMDISRLSSFYAIAFRQVPKSHWELLRRETLKCGFFSGFGSPTGSMEEFFLPEIYLKSPQGSACYESLKYALAVQRKLALGKGLPFGLSQSGVYRFSSLLEYKSAHLGAPKAAVTPQTDNCYAVSPHSVFLSLSYDPKAGVENLVRMKKAGAYGNFGFYEAIDYTSQNSAEVVKMLKSRHVGAEIASGLNVLENSIMQKRFVKSTPIHGALELLEERFLPGSAPIRPPHFTAHFTEKPERFCDISPTQPRVRLIQNSGYSLILTDSGVSLAIKSGLCLYSQTYDAAYEKRGFFAAVRAEDELIMLDTPENLTCEFNDFGARFIKSGQSVSAQMSVSLHETLTCEIREFRIKNLTQSDNDVSLLLYIEPSLLRFDERDSERKRMSIRLERDDKLKTVNVSKADPDYATHFAIGFYDDISFSASFDKESVFSHADGISEVFENADSIAPSLISEPEPCIFIKAKLTLSAGEEKSLRLFILCGESDNELSDRVEALRNHRLAMFGQNSTKQNAMAQLILSDILFTMRKSAKSVVSISKSFKADVALIVLSLNDKNDDEKLSSFLGAYKVIRDAGVPLQMAVLYSDEDQKERTHYKKLLAAAKKTDTLGFIYSTAGIIPVDEYALGGDAAASLKSEAAYIADDEILSPIPERKAFNQIEISKVLPDPPQFSEPIDCGGFNGLEYVISEPPETDWHHVLSNPVFGNVVTNHSLGTNSFGDMKERLILEHNGRYYDIINGSAACFAPDYAKYHAIGEGFKSCVSVSASQKGMCKRLEIKITSSEHCRLSYVCESGDESEIKSTDSNGTVITFAGKHLGISAAKPCKVIFDKEAFYAGEWDKPTQKTSGEFSALICELSGAETISFYLSLGASERSAARMYKHFCEPIPNKHQISRQADWARYQLLNGRIHLGDGGGVFCFDELLQDACGIVFTDPDRSKTEILRCCAHQFPEGDALTLWKKSDEKSGIRRKNVAEYLWLVFAVSEYIESTDDKRILDLGVRYLGADPVKESVYEHCRRALDLSIEQKGSHGLIINSEGVESVQLSEFFVITLERFCKAAQYKGDNMYAAVLMFNSKQMREAIKTYGRDAGQYIGGYLPMGETWGSARNDACRICLMPQVIAQLAGIDEHFDKTALLKSFDELCDTKRSSVKLFSPPFASDSTLAPKEARYLPAGIKQNGGMITASALMLSIALRKAGFSEEADAVFRTTIPEERAKSAGYKAEPYYICGEIYTNKNCFGRGANPIFNSAAALYLRMLIAPDDEGCVFSQNAD